MFVDMSIWLIWMNYSPKPSIKYLAVKMTYIVEELNKLVQERSAKGYAEKFEELKTLINTSNHLLPELY